MVLFILLPSSKDTFPCGDEDRHSLMAKLRLAEMACIWMVGTALQFTDALLEDSDSPLKSPQPRQKGQMWKRATQPACKPVSVVTRSWYVTSTTVIPMALVGWH